MKAKTNQAPVALMSRRRRCLQPSHQAAVEHHHATMLRSSYCSEMKALGIHTGADLRDQSLAFLQQHFGKAGRGILARQKPVVRCPFNRRAGIRSHKRAKQIPRPGQPRGSSCSARGPSRCRAVVECGQCSGSHGTRGAKVLKEAAQSARSSTAGSRRCSSR